ncbi:MAG TPA: hypothetical protein DEA08_32660 [Planctomycetes bacterium]|nr:hypothetical protein [Planctomycetota bacterium]
MSSRWANTSGRVAVLVLAWVLAQAASGCGTFLSWGAGQVPKAKAYHPRTDLIYSGVRTDADFLLHDPTILFKVLSALDLPFSFVFDTIAFPVTGVLRLFAEREWFRLDEDELRDLAETHEDEDVRAGARGELERRARTR